MANMKVIPRGSVANMVVTRADGHQLSLSSMDCSLIEWTSDKPRGESLVVTDHGWVSDPARYLDILTAFLASDRCDHA